MIRKKFTLNDIETYLADLGFVWKDKIIYNPNNRRYKTAKLSDFNKNVFMKLQRGDLNILILATIDNNTFELINDKNKLNASNNWIEYLESKKNTVSI